MTETLLDMAAPLMKRFLGRIIRFVPAPILAAVIPHRRYAISQEKWDQQYADGVWDYMANELGRYSVIAGYCQSFKPTGRVLDVGCGVGLLARQLSPQTSYFGIDLSGVAIEQARQMGVPGAEFAMADATSFQPIDLFDIIIFNECLWYFKEPAEQVQRYIQFLAPGGVLIVSIWYSAETRMAWKSLNKLGLTEQDRVSLIHRPSRRRWDIFVYTTCS